MRYSCYVLFLCHGNSFLFYFVNLCFVFEELSKKMIVELLLSLNLVLGEI